MSDAQHILIVDDDPRVRKMLCRYLEDEGFRVTEAENGPKMRDALAGGTVALIMLDLVMPGEDGLTLAREVRHTSDVPIIILTGKGDVVDRIVGLEMGADDYITKPFHLREVLARIRTVLRRHHDTPPPADASAATPSDPSDDVSLFDGWRLDMGRRELYAPDGAPVILTTGEFDLLRAFVTTPNRVLNRDQLMDLTKGRDWTPYDRSIDTQIGRLRKKIERDPKNPDLIKTVRGIGYTFTAKISHG